MGPDTALFVADSGNNRIVRYDVSLSIAPVAGTAFFGQEAEAGGARKRERAPPVRASLFLGGLLEPFLGARFTRSVQRMSADLGRRSSAESTAPWAEEAT